jgi:hypothetical protein
MPEGRVTARHGGEVVKLWEQLKPQLASVVAQTWQRLARYTDKRETHYPINSTSSTDRDKMVASRSMSAQEPERDRRRQGRVAVHMLSQFSSKTSIVAGEGELRDLSPSGCRITTPVRVPLGTAVECWIYPQNGNPFAVDEARVQWIGHRELGLLFTHVRSGVQRRITDMCRKMRPL